MAVRDPRIRRGAAIPRAILVLAAGCWSIAVVAGGLEVIELRHRLADDVIEVLRPLLEPGGVMTGADSTLFVRTGPANLEQIRAAVAVLDRAPRQLLITVGQGSVADDRSAGVRAGATIGDDARVSVNRPPGGDPGAVIVLHQGGTAVQLHDVGSVRTLEGSETWIGVGQSAPVTTTHRSTGSPGATVVETTEYRTVSRGFYATARVSGETVTVDLAPQQQRLHGYAASGRIDTAGVATRVSGRLGEWIAVGGTGSTQQVDRSGLLQRSSHDTVGGYSVWLKVEDLP